MIRVLLLEDSAIDAELIARQLAKLGDIEIARASRRSDFAARLAEEAFDLILSDYSLPDFFEFQALELAKSAQAEVPFIYVSGVLGEGLATEALRAGATDYVTKRELSRIPMVAERALREARERRERQRAAAALRESEERFSTMADNAPALIWSTGADGQMTFVNRRFEAEFGIPASRLLESGWSCFVHDVDFPTFDRKWRGCFARRKPFIGEVRVRRATGEGRWLRLESSPRYDSEGGFLGYVGCAVDITQARLAKDALEAEVAKRTEELRIKDDVLRQSQKMEAIGQLTGGIAHDFNNMLAGIVAGCELIRLRISNRRYSDSLKYIDAVTASANRAAALTQRLLAFSRRQTLDVRSMDVNALIASLEDLLRRTIGESVRLSTELDVGLWPANIDSNQFESAILNLALNARDAMPAGGRLTISTRNVVETAREARSLELAPGSYALVEVIDEGLGMSPEVKSRVFDPFFTTKPLGQGTGLGLSMIYGFMAQIGGHVRIESEVGSGTRVLLYLPRGDRVDEVAQERRAPSRAQRGSGSVLIVEDESVVRMLLGDYLRDAGYDVREAEGAGTALPILAGDSRVDLLLTDVGLPGMNGRDLAREARRLRPDLNILFATGYAEGASRADLVGERMDLVAKPFDLEEVAEKIRGLIAD